MVTEEISYTKGGSIEVIVNAGKKAVDIDCGGEVLFSNLLSGGRLQRNGAAVIRKNKEGIKIYKILCQ